MHTHVCTLHTHTCMWITYRCEYIYISTYVRAYTHTCIIHNFKFTCLHVYIPIYIHKYIHIYILTYKRTYIHTNIHAYVRTKHFSHGKKFYQTSLVSYFLFHRLAFHFIELLIHTETLFINVFTAVN